MCHAARALCGLLIGCATLGCARTPGQTSTPPPPFEASQPNAAVPVVWEKPPLPFRIQEPPPEPGDVLGNRVEQALPSELARLAHDFAAGGNYPLALRCQYWLVRQAGEGRYDLACYYSRTGAVDAALYWLQQAAEVEGVDASHAGIDEDLAHLRADSRWPALQNMLDRSNRYWETQGKPVTTLILPRGYTRDRGPLVTVLWLHGMGSKPQGFVDPGDDENVCHQLADELNVAFIGVSGTVPRGKNFFVWAEDPDRDLDRVKDAIKDVSDRLQVGSVIAFGFSQGAQTAVELAARNPELFAGAIALSPGSNAVRLSEISASPLLKQRGFIVGCGDGEHPGNRAQTATDGKWLKAAGAKVELAFFLGQHQHTFPEPFMKLFPEWIRFIQSAAKP